jgi:hypothetical protein
MGIRKRKKGKIGCGRGLLKDVLSRLYSFYGIL